MATKLFVKLKLKFLFDLLPIYFVMVCFPREIADAPQAKVKKRKTVKQVIQEKEEKAKEQTLRREEDRKLLKEVSVNICDKSVYLDRLWSNLNNTYNVFHWL